jgi:O-antigen/teichoic acid export membrane protein
MAEDATPARKSSVAAAAAATFVVNVASAMLALVNVLIVARVLGPSGRGEVAFLLTIGALTSRLSAFGVQEANVNFASREPELRPRLASNSILLALVFGWLAGAVVFALAAAFPDVGGDTDTTLRTIVLASIPVLVFQGSLYRLVQADYAFGVSNVAMLVPPLANLLLNGALAATGALDIGTAVGAWLVGQVASAVLLGWYVHRRLAGFGTPDLPLARRQLGFGLKTHAGRLMMLGNYRLDQWFLGSMAGNRELGLYSVAVSWFDALTHLPNALAMVLRPDLVRAEAGDAAKRSATAFRATMLVTLVFVVGVVVLAPILCVTVFGEEFRGSVDDLRVLAPGAIALVALRIFGSALTSQRKPMLETAAIAVGLVFTIVLDLTLIPRHGGLGAAIASTLAYTAAALAIVTLFVRALGGRWGDLRPRVDDGRLVWRRARSLLRR